MKSPLSVMILLLVASQADATSIRVVVTNTIGITEAVWGSRPGYILEGPEVLRSLSTISSGGVQYPGYSTTYRYTIYIDNSDVPNLYASASDQYVFYIDRDIDKQPEGFMDWLDDLSEPTFSRINKYLGGGRRAPCTSIAACRNLGAVTGTRGSIVGWSLVEQSPDAEIELLKDVVVADLASFEVPFLVESKGDEDWLELTMNDQVFFRSALATFNAGSWYAADVPLSLMRDGDNLIGFALYSEGEANSSVFFPTAVVPLPGTVWLLGAAIGLLAGRALRHSRLRSYPAAFVP